MDEIRICYSDRDNMGDLINPYIVEKCLGVKPIPSNKYDCDISGIGSGLYRFFVRGSRAEGKISLHRRLRVYANFYRRNKPLILWSAGFLSTPKGNEIILRKKLKVASVRGEMSKMWVEKILGRSLDCTTGDAGLLASELIPTQEKCYRLGIIPHDRERGEPEFEHLAVAIPDSVIIDVRGDVIERLKTIAQCECIVSSSLHGLIFADSFHIPNRQVVLTNRLAGDGFKFVDYYSSFGVEQPMPINLKSDSVSIKQITKGYTIPKNQVEQKKEQIKEAFFRFVRS